LEGNKSKYSKFKAAAQKYSTQEEWESAMPSKGKRDIAKKIIEISKKNNLPVSHSPEIIEYILNLKSEDVLPEKILALIDEIYKFLYFLQGRKHV